MMKIVIIEDEKLTAIDLADTLKKVDGDVEIVTILSSVKQAIHFLRTNNDYNLIFSDIQLPDGLCFDIFNEVKTTVPVIFCTAYDKYSIKAFDANGIAYLLKPFNKASIAKALDKYMTLKSNFHATENNFNKLLQKLSQQVTHQSFSIIIHQGEKIIPVEIQNIALFFLEDEYAFAVTFDSKKHITTQNLEELESLCGDSFFRANRQYLVNRKAIKDASHYLNRKILINLNVQYPGQILVGKLKTSLFVEWLANH
jgi:two-component system, LytTR family, response regulator LytT